MSYRRWGMMLLVLLALSIVNTFSASVLHAQEDQISPGPTPGPSPSPTPSPVSQFPNWAVEVFNVDDEIRVICNGSVVGRAYYNQSATIPLNNCLTVRPDNRIFIEVYNAGPGPWTFGFRLTRNGQPATTVQGREAEGRCGQIYPGRASNSCTSDQSAGLKFTKRYRLERLPGQ
jgi:hypothetical protein